MKNVLLALFIIGSLWQTAYAQNTNVKSFDKNASYLLLQEKIKQIENKSIQYNYYLGDDLYNEKSFISKATITSKENNIEIYLYISTQKYDLHSSALIRSEHGESIIFNPSSIKDVSIKGKYTDYAKSELGLLVINFEKEIEKHTYLKKKKNEDPTLLDHPLVYEFELPYLKTDNSNPQSIQEALLILKKGL